MGTWHESHRLIVGPAYFGMAFFAEAAPTGSKIIAMSGGNQSEYAGWIKAFSTLDEDGTLRVAIINKASFNMMHPSKFTVTLDQPRGEAYLQTLSSLGGNLTDTVSVSA
jgi:hypothetical protein